MQAVAIYEYALLTATGTGKRDEIAEATALNDGSVTIRPSWSATLAGGDAPDCSLRVSLGRRALVVQGEREQGLIGPDARHGSRLGQPPFDPRMAALLLRGYL